MVAATVAVLAAAALLSWIFLPARTTAQKATGGQPIAVRAIAAKRADVPEALLSVGTVQALNTVAIRTRVDGEIHRVAFREGQEVARGDILVELDPRPFEAQLRAALAQADKDRAQLDNAKHDLQRYEQLEQNGSGTAQVLDTARALVAQLRATVEADLAQADAARLQVQFATIRAPMNGRVGARLVDSGNVVHTTDPSPLVVLTQARPAAVSFAVPQDALPALRSALARGKVPVSALTQDGSQELDQGTLTLIDNQVDAGTGTVRCKALFPNATEALWPGQFVSVRTQLRVLRQAIVVPATALQNGAQGAFVYVVDGGKAVARPVHVASSQGDSLVIDRGLADGERVVTEGQFQVEAGAAVKVQP